MGLVVNSVKSLSVLRSAWIFYPIVAALFSGLLGGTYMKGRHDGAKRLTLHYEQEIAHNQDLVIARQQDLMEEVQSFLEEERTYNRNLSRLVREEIKSSKLLYKELQNEPVIVNEDCTLEYTSTLGVFNEAVSLSKNLGSDEAPTEAPD